MRSEFQLPDVRIKTPNLYDIFEKWKQNAISIKNLLFNDVIPIK
jgi:hypothetical protein